MGTAVSGSSANKEKIIQKSESSSKPDDDKAKLNAEAEASKQKPKKSKPKNNQTDRGNNVELQTVKIEGISLREAIKASYKPRSLNNTKGADGSKQKSPEIGVESVRLERNAALSDKKKQTEEEKNRLNTPSIRSSEIEKSSPNKSAKASITIRPETERSLYGSHSISKDGDLVNLLAQTGSPNKKANAKGGKVMQKLPGSSTSSRTLTANYVSLRSLEITSSDSRRDNKSQNPKEKKLSPTTKLKPTKPATNNLFAESTTIKALVSPRNIKSETSETAPILMKNSLEVDQNLSGRLVSPKSSTAMPDTLSKKIKAHKGPFHLESLSAKTSKKLIKEVSRVIEALKITCEPLTKYSFRCEKDDIKFDIEIRFVTSIEKLYTLKFTKIEGDTTRYAELSINFQENLKL